MATTPITFISPDGRQLVDSRGDSDDTRLRALGYKAVDRQDVTKKAIEKTYNTWKDDAEAIGLGAMQGLPGLTGTIQSLIPASAAQKLATEITNESVAHPYLTTASQFATGAGLIAATGGVGAAALETTGAVGTAALLQTAAFNAAGSVAMGAGTRFDARAIHHALSPAGEEKLHAETGHEWLVDAAIGAAVPVVGGLAAKAFKGLAAVAEETKNSQIQRSILDQVKLNEAQYAGRQSELWQMVEGNNWHNLPRDEVSLAVKNKLASATDTMNAVKKAAVWPLQANQAGEFADTVGTLLSEKPELAQKVIAKATTGLDVETLHGIRQDIRQSINWREFAKDPTGQQNIVDAHELTSATINGLLKQNDPLLADSWINANKAYSNLSVLQDVFKQGRAAAPVSTSFWKDVAMISGIGRMFGWGKAAMWAAQGKNAGGVFQKFADGKFAETAGALSGVFDNVGSKLSSALAENYYGLAQAPQLVRDTEEVANRRAERNFDVVAASIAAASRDTNTSAANIMNAYKNTGLPDELAARYTQQAIAKNSYLASKLPQPTGASLGYVMPSNAQPSRQEQQHFLNFYDAIHDPVSAIQNPTLQGMEALSLFSPGLLADTQNHILQHLRSGQAVSIRQQSYAAKLLGTPVSVLTDVTTYRTMQTARQLIAQQDQQKQLQAQKGSRSNAASSATADLTRSEKLEQR